MFEYIHIYFWIGCGVGSGKEVGKAEAFQNLKLDLLQSYLFVNFVFIKFLFYLFIYIYVYNFFDIDLKLYGWDDIFWFCFLLQLFAFFFSKQKRRWICRSVWPIYQPKTIQTTSCTSHYTTHMIAKLRCGAVMVLSKPHYNVRG